MGKTRPAKTISFAVGSKYGPRSGKWNISVSNRDVYVTNSSLGSRMHVSLHGSGQWHIKAYHRSKLNQLSTLIKLHQDAVPTGNYPVGLYLGFPDESLRRASDLTRASDPDLWLDRAPCGGCVEVAVMSWNLKAISEQWPGRAAGTGLIAVYRVAEFEVIGILARGLGASDPVTLSLEQVVAAHRPIVRPIVLDSPERRGLVMGTTAHGACVIIEFAVD